MTVNAISSYSLIQTTLDNVSSVESKLQDEQIQLSSGNAAQNFSQMSGQVQEYLNLDGVLAKNQQYQNNNAITSTFINQTSSALGNIVSTGNSIQGLITQQMTGVGESSATFLQQLQGMYQQVASQLNSQVNGQYLFSGSAINTPAVNANVYPTLAQSGTPDKSYYLGNSQSLTAQPQDNTTVTYNVTGDAPAFQDIMAGLSMAKEAVSGNGPVDTTMLQQAETFIQQGVQGAINLQATANANKVEYITIGTNLTNSQLYWQGIQQTIGNTDLVSVSTQVATNQGILQAAFEAFAKISSLTLSNYLK